LTKSRKKSKGIGGIIRLFHEISKEHIDEKTIEIDYFFVYNEAREEVNP